MAKEPRVKKSGFWIRLWKSVLILFGLLVVLSVGAVVQFWATLKSPWDFLPQKYQVYFQIPSIKTVLDSWINLEATQIVLQNSPGLEGVQKALLDVKSIDAIKNPAMQNLLDVPAHVVLGEQGQPMIVLDLGWRSIVTRWSTLFAPWFNVKGLSVVQKNSLQYLQYDLGKTQKATVLFKDNLALVTLSEDSMFEMLDLTPKNLALNQKPKDEGLLKLSQPSDGKLRFLADAGALLEAGIPDPEAKKKLSEAFEWRAPALVEVELGDSEIKIDVSASFDSKVPAIRAILDRSSNSSRILPLLPDSTYLVSSINLAEFQELVDLASYVRGRNFDAELKDAEGYLKSLLGMDWNEFLLSWLGNEASVSFLPSSPDPILSLTVKDDARFQAALEKLSKSLVLTTDSTLVLDGVRVHKIAFPPIVKSLLDLFEVHIDTPYYWEKDHTIHICQNAEALARLANDLNQGKLLARTVEYQSLAQGLATDTGLYLYYDLDKTVPFFLRGRGVLAEALKLYNKGLVTLRHQGSKIDLHFVVRSTQKRASRAFPGYPVKLPDGLASTLTTLRWSNSTEPQWVYVNADRHLVIRSALTSKAFDVPVEDDTRILWPPVQDQITAIAPSGNVYRVGSDGKPVPGFPKLTSWSTNFSPTLWDQAWVGFDSAKAQLEKLSPDGHVEPFALTWNDPISVPVQAYQGNLAVVTSSFDGTVFVLDGNGTVKNGWPQKGGGLTRSNAVFAELPQGARVLSLVQKGLLNVWNLDGVLQAPFPLELPGVFYAPPLVVRSKTAGSLILCLAQNGVVFEVTTDGQIKRSLAFPVNGKEARMAAFDIDRDGNDEVFVFGDKNSIEGFDLDLQTLPGFPVKGSQKPSFIDLNLDGQFELVSGSYDGNVYAYTLVK